MGLRRYFYKLGHILLIGAAVVSFLLILVLELGNGIRKNNQTEITLATSTITIPTYSGEASAIVNNNVPMFTENDYKKANDSITNSEELIELINLDYLGRTQSAFMLVTNETITYEERESIGMIKPSGWVQNRYDDIIPNDDKYLYNRCHLLGYKLSGLNAVEENLITCTRQMNIGRMLDIEIEVANYAQNGGKVLYRVTPYYDGHNLLSNGVLIEAKSLDSDDISICEFVYNVQDGIIIDYTTGNNWASDN